MPTSVPNPAAPSGRDDPSDRDNPSSREPSHREPADRLIAAAGPVFARRGFDKATVREIAGVADVNLAAVSYYFGDKMGLYRAVVASIRRKRERQFPTPAVDAADPAETLGRLVDTLLSRMLSGKESGWESQLMMREIHQPTIVLREMIEEYFRPLYEALCETITLLLARCESPDANAAETHPAAVMASDRRTDAWLADAVVPQMAFSVVGQCHHHMIAGPVIEQLIDADLRHRYYDQKSIGRHITAMTLAACDGHSIVDHRRRLDRTKTSPPSST